MLNSLTNEMQSSVMLHSNHIVGSRPTRVAAVSMSVSDFASCSWEALSSSCMEPEGGEYDIVNQFHSVEVKAKHKTTPGKQNISLMRNSYAALY